MGLSLAVMVLFCSLCFPWDPITKLPRNYSKIKGAFSCVIPFSKGDLQVFGNYRHSRRHCLQDGCGGAQQSHPAAQGTRNHSFDFEGNMKIHLLRCTSATISAAVLLHVTTSHWEKQIFMKGWLIDRQSKPENKQYSLQLAIFWKVYSCQSSARFLRWVFPGIKTKGIPWEPLPRTPVFSIFLSHSGPLQGSAAHLVPTPLSDLLSQPQKSLGQWDPQSLATACEVSFWSLGSLPSPARGIWWEVEKSRATRFGMGALGKLYGG